MKRTLRWLLLLGLTASTAVAQDFLSKGKVALSTHDTTAAIQAYTAALKTGQKPAEANYYLGAIAYSRHEYGDAQKYLEESVRYEDENADAHGMLGRVYLEKKNLPAALNAYRKAVKLAPKNVTHAADLGKALLAVDSVDAAIVQLTRAKDLDGENADVYAALGAAYLRQNVPPLAQMNYEKAITLAPKMFAYRDSLAGIFLKMKKWPEAIAQYDTMVTLDSTNVQPLLDLGRILSKAVGPQKRLAVRPLEGYLAKKPKSVEGLTLLTKVYFQLEFYDSSAATGQRAVALNPKDPELWRELGRSLVEKREKDPKGAIAAYDKLKAMNEFKPGDHVGLGIALFLVGRDDDASAELTAAFKSDSTNCDAFFPLGSIMMKKQDYASAAGWFEKRIGCDSLSLSSYLNASACYWQLKNWDRIRALLFRALALKPDFLTTRLWLARYYLQTDSLDMARDQYDEVLKEGSASPDRYKKEMGEAYSMIASIQFTKKQYSASVDSYKKAVQLSYDNSAMELSWGQAILQTLDPKESQEEGMAKKQDAVAHFRKSITLDQGNAAAHLWLAQGLILMRVPGEDEKNKALQEEACSEYKKTLRLQPGNADAKKGMDLYGCK